MLNASHPELLRRSGWSVTHVHSKPYDWRQDRYSLHGCNYHWNIQGETSSRLNTDLLVICSSAWLCTVTCPQLAEHILAPESALNTSNTFS